MSKGALTASEGAGEKGEEVKMLLPPKRIFIPLLWGCFYAGIFFSLIVATLLVANYFQIITHKPIDNPALEQLRKQLESTPTDGELKEEIRALDLLSRKAFFISQSHIRQGALLLLVGVMVLLLSRKLLSALTSSLPHEPLHNARHDRWWIEQRISRRSIAWGGILLLLAALFAGWRTDRLLSGAVDKEQEYGKIEIVSKNTWPFFRGPGGNGVAAVENAPVDWDGKTMRNIKWKVKTPLPGNSSPILWEDRMFLTGGDRTHRELYCYEKDDGKLLWKRKASIVSDSIVKRLKVDRETGYAAPTPACDGKRVFAIFPTGECVCCNLKGKIIWQRRFSPPENHYGHSSSLITYRNMLFVQLDGYENGQLYALQAKNGKTIWSVKRSQLSWASPICVYTGKKQELILTDNAEVISYNPLNGSVFWHFDCLYGEVGPSAAYAAGRVFVAGETANATCIALSGSDKNDSSKIVWTWNDNLPSTASPVATERFLFLATAEGIVSCVNVNDGSTIWEEEFENGFYASPIIVDNRVYLLDRKGTMRIFAIENTYTFLGEPKLDESAVATPAFSDGTVIIRGTKHLFCIEKTNG
jgi:outer membrane protein assembly factor BamB